MKFLVDAQLPRQLALWLCEQGCEAVHTLDLPDRNRTTDSEIIRLADLEQRIVVTKDADFVSSHLLRDQPQRLLLTSTGNIGNQALMVLFRHNWAGIRRMLEAGQFVELSASAVTLHR